GVNTPRSDEDRLELMELIVFFLPKVEKVRIGVNAIDLQVFVVMHMLLLFVHKLLRFSLTNWCCSLSAVRSSIKQVNDVTRLQALVDRKKVVVTEATIREALRLDDAEGVDCLPNEEIFTELARMGYEKPSTNLTGICKYKESRKRVFWVETPLFEGMLVAQEVGKEKGVDEHVEEVTASDAAHGDDSAAHREVPTVIEEPSIPSPTPPTPPSQPPQDIPLTSQVQQAPPQSPHVQPPSPQHQHPPQPQQAADFPMSLLQEVIDACAALTRRVEHLKYDKVAQALEITKVETSDDTVMDDTSNQERMINEMDQDDAVVLKDDKEEYKEVADAEEDKVDGIVNAASETVTVASVIITTAEPQVSAATTATLIVAHSYPNPNRIASWIGLGLKWACTSYFYKFLGLNINTCELFSPLVFGFIIFAAEPQVLAATITATPVRVAVAPSRRRKGVIIRDPEEESTTSSIISTETKSKEKGKGIMVEEPKPINKKQQIEIDEEYARKLHAELNKDIDWDVAINHLKVKAKEDPAVQRYQVMKRKPQTEAQARKNVMMYLKNVASIKLDYFKGVSYDDISPIFEAKFNSNVDFLLKTKEQMEEEENKAL
nr:hypothetical protein [Tanacetum cinerariifolium]